MKRHKAGKRFDHCASNSRTEFFAYFRRHTKCAIAKYQNIGDTDTSIWWSHQPIPCRGSYEHWSM